MILFLVFGVFTLGVHAEENNLILVLNLPNEGETFYSGPSSFLYNIPIDGTISSPNHDPSEIYILIEILQNSLVVVSHEMYPDAKGRFRIYAQVNPGAHAEAFAAEFIPCGDTCHGHPTDQFARDTWNPTFALPAGPLTISITATDPNGESVNLQRKITVDRSELAEVEVQLEIINGDGLPIEGIPVSASTWLYMWRSRIYSGGTDGNGLARFQVEALQEKTTKYRFEVKPTVINGIRYESVSAVDVFLPVGDSNAPKVTLQVKASMATISGQVSGEQPLPEMIIWAIPDNNDELLKMPVETDGTFTFESVPINKYSIIVEFVSQDDQDYSTDIKSVDLFKNIDSTIDINIFRLDGKICQGEISSESGNKLPFAWAILENGSNFSEVQPDTSKFKLYNLEDIDNKIILNAPGYYSQIRTIEPGSQTCANLEYRLTKHPDSREISWGDGSIFVPAGTLLSQSGNHFFVEKGWLWGQNTGDETIILQFGTAEITLNVGRFAAQVIPGLTPLFLLMEGEGTFQKDSTLVPSTIKPGTMIHLDSQSGYPLYPIEPIFTSHFLATNKLPVAIKYEPSLKAQLLNKLALIGIDAAKLVTFVTYTFVFISIMLYPFILLIRWIRKKTKSNRI